MADRRRAGCLVRTARLVWALLHVIIVLYGFLTIVYLLGRVTVGEQWALVGALNNALPWLAVIATVFGLIGMLSFFRRLLVILQMPIIIVFLALFANTLLPPGDAPMASGTPLTAMTYNTLSRTSNPQRVAAVIAETDADIVGLQELGPAQAEAIESTLAARYPYRLLHPVAQEVRGVGLLSRYPVLSEEVILPLDDDFLHLRAVLDVDGTPVTVLVAHPRPPRHRYNPVTYDDSLRDSSLAILYNEYVQPQGGPLLLLCDCNIASQSETHDELDVLLDDAFEARGWGLGFSFPSKTRSPVPLIRLDYIWVTDDTFTVENAEVYHDAGTSDHFPVIADLVLSPAVETAPMTEATEGAPPAPSATEEPPEATEPAG